MNMIAAHRTPDARLATAAARLVRVAITLVVTLVLVALTVGHADAADGSATPGATTGVGQVAAKAKAHRPAKGRKGDRGSKAARGARSAKARVTATLASLPPIAQPGTSPAAPSNLASLVATFSPAAPGQPVTLERKTVRGWKVVATATEDAWGTATFATAPGVYRATTSAAGLTWVSGTVVADRWTPQFEDTFSGTALDATVWNDQKRERESVYAPRTCARVDPSARSVGGGVLRLGIGVDPTMGGATCSYTSNGTAGTQQYLVNSQVATENTRFFQHGIVAARIKPQRAKGMHTGFWMLPAGTTYTDGVPSAGTEIDIMEFFGENGRGNEAIGSHVHYYEAGWEKVSHGDLFPATRQVLGKNHSWWDEFHVFSVEWTPTAYIFRVDGREYYRETAAVSHAAQYLVLSNLTSDYELANLTPDELGDAAQVDWVRVYDATSIESARVTRGRRIG